MLNKLARQLSEYNLETEATNCEALKLLMAKHFPSDDISQIEKIVWKFDHDADLICEALLPIIRKMAKQK